MGPQHVTSPVPAAAPSDRNAASAAVSKAAEAAPVDSWQALRAFLGLNDREPLVLDLCGVGRMPISKPLARDGASPAAGLDALLPPHLGSEAQAQALQSLLKRLDSGPPRWRAAAALMRGADEQGQSPAVALRRLAQQSDDPVVAMMALQTCKQDQACRAQTAQRWLQLEPDNLAALLETQALLKQPDITVLARLAQARQHRQHYTGLMQVVMEATANDPPSYLQPGLWIYAIGVQAAFSMAPFSGLMGQCPDNMAADHPNKSLCTALAKTLVDHSDTALAYLFGLRLAERTYLSKQEAAQQRAALNTAMGLNPAWLDPMPTSCAAVERLRADAFRTAQLGELAALRAQAAEQAASAAQRAPPSQQPPGR